MRLGQRVRAGLFSVFVVLTAFVAAFVAAMVVAPVSARAAPYAAMVVDARTGKVLHSRNADTRLHPASLTKMMTLYIAFEAMENGEISANTKVRISKNAAAEQPSKLGLRAGQKIAFRYLVRAAAVKSANDAATAIGEALSGSEAAFAQRMTRTARALGMDKTTFKNAHGLTASGHLSTARDMTTLGRHLFYDYPDYYNLFSRKSTDAGVKEVANTNRRLLGSYRGADGIKTGYTRAAGFNLVASAHRGQQRIIATVFGGRSSLSRNARVAELLDLGFSRAPRKASIQRPARPAYRGNATRMADATNSGNAGKTIRLVTAVTKSARPKARPLKAPSGAMDVAMDVALKDSITSTLDQVLAENVAAQQATDQAVEIAARAASASTPRPMAAPRPDAAPDSGIAVAAAGAGADAASDTKPPQATTASRIARLAAISPKARPDVPSIANAPDEPEIVTRVSTSGGRHWGINIGRYGTRYDAERVLLQTALTELGTLDTALRKVVQNPRGFEANFVGMTQEQADVACRRLQSLGSSCQTIGPRS